MFLLFFTMTWITLILTSEQTRNSVRPFPRRVFCEENSHHETVDRHLPRGVGDMDR